MTIVIDTHFYIEKNKIHAVLTNMIDLDPIDFDAPATKQGWKHLSRNIRRLGRLFSQGKQDVVFENIEHVDPKSWKGMTSAEDLFFGVCRRSDENDCFDEERFDRMASACGWNNWDDAND